MMPMPRLRPRLRPFLAALALLALPALADTGVSFAGLKTDPKAPVNVTADQLTVAQADGTATFSGNVVVTQSDLQLNAAKVEVIYAQDKKAIAQLHATGGVTVKAGANAAQADEALYTVDTSDLVMTGKVLLTEGQATIAGEKLTVNLKTGLGTMSGRVSSTFTPGGN